MKTIPVNVGKKGKNGIATALVSDEDYSFVSSKNWSMHKKGYPVTAFKNKRGKWTNRPMHKFLMSEKEGFEVDHINRNRLDNRRENLRYATDLENPRNRIHTKANKFGQKGVYKDGKWFRAGISVNGKKIYLGRHETPEDAGAAYAIASAKYFGEFSAL